MKSILILCSCLSIFFFVACNGEEGKKDTVSAENTSTSNEETSVEKEEAVTDQQIADKNEASEGLSEDVSDNTEGESNSEVEKVSSVEKDDPAETRIEESEAEALIPSEDTDLVEKKQPNIIFISVVPDMMKFDKEVFTVIAGQEIIIELDNPDGMQHNLVISKPGTLQKVGDAADLLARDPKGAQKQYVPEIPAVLFATKLLDPGEVVTLKFTAPSEPGDYPFICTFPGHWRMMNGIMKVTK